MICPDFELKISPKLGYVLVMLMLGQGAFRPFEPQLALIWFCFELK